MANKVAKTTLDKIFDEIEGCIEKIERLLKKDKGGQTMTEGAQGGNHSDAW